MYEVCPSFSTGGSPANQYTPSKFPPQQRGSKPSGMLRNALHSNSTMTTCQPTASVRERSPDFSCLHSFNLPRPTSGKQIWFPSPPILLSNALISTTFPSLTALFVGATSGIGESTLKCFVKNANTPTIYFVGRSEKAGERIVRELEGLNAGGRYEFIQADVGLLGVVDGV